jgi:hypothetical protein
LPTLTLSSSSPVDRSPVLRSAPLAAPLAALLTVVLLSGCGEVRLTYGDYLCPDDEPPAIVVEFVAAGDGGPVAVQASGTLRDGAYVEQMVPTSSSRHAPPDRSYGLAGGYGRSGIYDVRIETALGELQQWSNVGVQADRCGPFTVVLQARLRVLQ